jgi:hypothetical protein
MRERHIPGAAAALIFQRCPEHSQPMRRQDHIVDLNGGRCVRLFIEMRMFDTASNNFSHSN